MKRFKVFGSEVSGPGLSPTYSALSDGVVLKEIFKNLSYEDQRSCCQVSKLWLSVLDPLMCFVRVTIEKQNFIMHPDKTYRAAVAIEEIVGYGGNANYQKIEFEDLFRQLRKWKKNYFLSIELEPKVSIYWLSFPEKCDELYIAFLKEFGGRIHVLNYSTSRYDPKYTYNFAELQTHLTYTPNVEVVKCSDTGTLEGPQEVPEIFSKKLSLPRLRKIYMGPVYLHWKYLLKNAENVEELWKVPISAAGALQEYNKIEAVKSLDYKYLCPLDVEGKDYPPAEQLFKSFSALGVKLFAAEIPSRFHQFRCITPKCGPDCAYVLKTREHLNKIFESSKDTVQIIKLISSKKYGFFFPTEFKMSAVKIVQLQKFPQPVVHIKGEPYDETPWAKTEEKRGDDWAPPKPEYHYFPEGTEIKSIFPNIEGLDIEFDLFTDNFTEYFPPEMFGPLKMGSAFKKLKIQGASPDCFPQLIELFPSVTHLEMHSTLKHFNQVFPIIASGWASLQSLTVIIDVMKNGFVGVSKEANLDSSLTGIPQTACEQLRSSDDIVDIEKQRLTEKSLLNMTDLKHLRFLLESAELYEMEDSEKELPKFITFVSVEHALKRLPQLEVTVCTLKDHEDYAPLKTAFDHIADHVQFKNTYVHSQYPFL